MENADAAASCRNGDGTLPPPPPPHVAMLATPGMGHLIPLAELAKRLAQRHGVTSTFIAFASTASPTPRAFLASLPPAVVSLALRDAAVETLMPEECARALPALTEALLDLKRRVTTAGRRLAAFVTDLFGADAFDAMRAAGVQRRYFFFPTGSRPRVRASPEPPRSPPRCAASNCGPLGGRRCCGGGAGVGIGDRRGGARGGFGWGHGRPTRDLSRLWWN